MRWVDLERCGNFRDLGGYETVDGRRTRWGVLYRSAKLDAPSETDGDRLRSLHIRSILDLRTADERRDALPWTDGGRIEVVSLPSSNPDVASLRLGSYDPGPLYAASIEDRTRDFPGVLSLLADRRRLPAVISCSGGKDRTGMVVALILGTLGVPEETIVEDYAMSDACLTRDPAGFAAALARVNAAGLDPEVLRTRPATMRHFLREVTARCGSIRAFAAQAGAADDVIARVRENLLEAPDSEG